ncbi:MULTISPECIES: ATP-binding cassette domain-containing protein [Brevibacterium]|uniref:ATP-binding cassette domain-containing protein n=1 Tax=Brevibacterium aurantiacum TaxID=273384 RepID=A0A4Z0KRW4_BREAU|nr:ATP-binding cassette domain-containing protein [Brevibacterium aurantiacum]TGD40484.1 ATP-binding cassette domain-containing protein [Brevibacterium aurantiacum]
MSRVLRIRDFAVTGRTAHNGGIGFDVHAGEITALVGRSGTGKSTLIECVAGVGPKHQGELTRPTGGVGVHFQTPRLLPWLSAHDNVMYPLTARSRHDATPINSEAASELLNDLGVHEHQARPDELSGGQRARVSLARALLSTSTLLLADEPFAHLDATSADAVEAALRRKATTGCAILLTAHEPVRIAALEATEVQMRS